jgi:flagellar L-ring protein precursor FlgH
MRTSSSNPFAKAAFLLLALAGPAAAGEPGAVFSGTAYTPLTSGARAGQPGDLLTIVLVERMSATKSNSATTGRDGSAGITPPVTGPLNFLKSTDLSAGGSQSFKGKGEAAQSNALTGEIAVTVVGVRPNGVLEVKGEKFLQLNRGDERIELTGLVRTADISSENRVLSTRVANARIAYTGKGEIARASKQGWLQRFFSKISPF